MKKVLLYGVCIFFGISETFASQKVDGFNIGVGVNIGRHNTSRNDNDLFDGDKKSIKSVVWGGSISIGYIKKINQFGIGLDLGCDADKSSKQLKISGYANNKNSNIYRNHISTIEQILYHTIHSMQMYKENRGIDDRIDNNNWQNLVKLIRYLGGQLDLKSDNSFINFVNNDINSDDLQDIVGEDNVEVIKHMGHGSSIDGLTHMSNYLGIYCHNGATILKHVADIPMKGGSPELGNNSQPGFFTDLAAIVHLMLGIPPEKMSDIGISENLDIDAYNLFSKIILSDFSDNVTHNIKFKTKSRFELSPHIGLKFGFYLDDNKSFIYSKIGVIQLNGRVVAGEKDDNLGAYFNVKSKNFHKITPMLTFGFNRQIGCSGWGVGFEISHAFKTSKKLDPVDVIGFKIYPKAKISRTSIRFLVTKTF